MLLKDVIQEINNIENNYPVSEITLNDICIWPIIRLQLSNYLFHKDDEALSEKLAPRNIQKPSLTFSIIRHLKLAFPGNNNNTEPDILWVTYPEHYSDENIHLGKVFHRFADSLPLVINENINMRQWLLIRNNLPDGLPREDFIVENLPLMNLINYLFNRKKIHSGCIRNQNAIKKLLKSLDAEIILPNIIDFCVSVIRKSIYFEKRLKTIKPKSVFMTCFYESNAFAIILAARRQNIPIVEVQHGAQNDCHLMYTNWHSVPEKGYKLLPDYFWSWGNVSADRIKKWVDKSSLQNVVVGGNPWLSLCLNNEFHADREEISLTRIDALSNFSKVILVSLQLWPDSLPEFLLEAIRKSPKGWCWVLRQHPLHRVKHKLIRNTIGDILSSVEIDLGEQVSLYTLLRVADIHITGYSTVAFEASSFDVSTIFIHQNALDGFGELIQDGYFGYADTTQKIFEMIEIKQKKIDYIVTDRSAIQNAVNKILKGRIN